MNHMLRLRITSQILSKLRNTPQHRLYSDNAHPRKRSSWTRRAVVGATLATGATVALTSTVYADDDAELATKPTLGSLVRAYSVYSMCSIPALVDASPKLLSVMSSVPGLKQITEAFVRITFFDQFVGADSAEEALPLLHSLRAAKKGVLFAYSVEVDENEATGASISSASADNLDDSRFSPHLSAADDLLPFKRIVDETIHCIDVAGDFEAGNAAKAVSSQASSHGRRTWVAVKMTALIPDAHALVALSTLITESSKKLPKSSKAAGVPFPGSARTEELDAILSDSSLQPVTLSPADIKHVRRLYADLSRICAHAQERGVKIIVDAEYSWYQPAIDALTLALMREFNAHGPSHGSANVQPLVYGTFQCYLRRTTEQLALAIEDSRKHNYSLGVKLVRGAYHPHELAAHKAALDFSATPHAPGAARPSPSISPDAEPPVWREKRDTDYMYNQCVRMLTNAIREDVERSPASAGPASVTDNSTSAGHDASGWLNWMRGAGAQTPAPSSASSTAASPSSTVPSIGVLFGTHNWDSCALILKELVRNGLAAEDPSVEGGIKVGPDVVERVAIGQLYGMCDDLTDWVVSHISSDTPLVIKYVPYGALEQVMPYLSRRAIENKSVLGGGAAQHERERAAGEIRKRIFG